MVRRALLTAVCLLAAPAAALARQHREAALSARRGSTVTSIYTQAEVVYGFALTVPGRSVCL